MLEKWQCHECEKGYLVLEEDAKGTEIVCPFCGKNENVEPVAGQNPQSNFQRDMGCLWPGYNELDKLAYMIRKGELTQEEANEYFRSLFNGSVNCE